jgi:hypothetical protein
MITSAAFHAQIVINEFQSDIDQIEIKNASGSELNVSNYVLCSFPEYNDLSELTIVSGDLNLSPGEILVVSGHSMGDADDELGLYTNGDDFTDPVLMIDYVEWGSTGHTRSVVAVAAGIWQTGDVIQTPTAGQSYMWDSEGDAPSNWFQGDATWGEENQTATNVTPVTDFNIKVWPNPGSEKLQLSFENQGLAEIIIFTQSGQLFKSWSTNESAMDISTADWTDGIYSILVTQGDNQTMVNWIKK